MSSEGLRALAKGFSRVSRFLPVPQRRHLLSPLFSDSLEGLLSLVRRSQFILLRITQKSLGTTLDSIKPLGKLWCLRGLIRSRSSLLTPGLSFCCRAFRFHPLGLHMSPHSPQVSYHRPLTDLDPVFCTSRNEINFSLRAPNSSGQREYTTSNRRRVVKTPGGVLVVYNHHIKKLATAPRAVTVTSSFLACVPFHHHILEISESSSNYWGTRDGLLVGLHGALSIMHLGRLVTIDGWAWWHVGYCQVVAACI